jgi:hypothetical protein
MPRLFCRRWMRYTTNMKPTDKIVVDAFWDEEAHVWVASARGEVGLVTEAPTIEALQTRIADLLPDLLDGHPGSYEVELISRSFQVVAAE